MINFSNITKYVTNSKFIFAGLKIQEYYHTISLPWDTSKIRVENNNVYVDKCKVITYPEELIGNEEELKNDLIKIVETIKSIEDTKKNLGKLKLGIEL